MMTSRKTSTSCQAGGCSYVRRHQRRILCVSCGKRALLAVQGSHRPALVLPFKVGPRSGATSAPRVIAENYSKNWTDVSSAWSSYFPYGHTRFGGFTSSTMASTSLSSKQGQYTTWLLSLRHSDEPYHRHDFTGPCSTIRPQASKRNR
ncbi:hypothetical protein SARC_10772 [Sphaeroforma arctica JP610]|uniref:Uncharacterized protein n=1 Tax=Sphaeroforma arctica JP610 TaxID=667725 RepID=A0A0L0FIY8_9EUKA|nr:hypothetical protein SARC_10772 [Sphaeroforma arctica JP610]KNC76742.1 hypothetical protein SARC_10772 [Sphaeroforma arctica JP610]|eukprot:XP_014150644.1 hypothetical protein SARC_10772 [Sphaeroforma arctica JP610]